ncbi:MAG: M20/M25/M40 family metallo-hydrolase [Alphaproteobacteria bacterium]|nr:M20/M25/M40 family metallo-hydrolase [Alphaproteobacteria bacterium]
MERRVAAIAAALVAVVALRAEVTLQAPSVSPERADELMRLHAALIGDLPHPTGTPEAAAVRERVAQALTDAGCAPHVQRAWSCGDGRCAWVENLWCRLGPEGEPVVLGLAHTDSVPAGPGAGDDGAAVVAWVEAVRQLAREPLRRPFVLVLTDGEELGLFGASALLDDPPFPEPIAMVVNLEARGSRGTSVLFQTPGEPRSWGAGYRSLGLRPTASSLYPAVYERMPNGTDLTVFGERGIAGADHAFLDEVAHYHTPLDDRAHLDPRSMAQHADLALGWVRALQHDLPPTSQAYADWLGLVLLSWPRTWSLPLTVLGLLAALGVAGVDRWTGRTRTKGLLLATGAVVGAVVLAAGLGWLASLALPETVGWSHPERVRALSLGLAVTTVLAGSAAGSPRARWAAVTVVVAALGVALALVDGRLAVLTVPALGLALAARAAPDAVAWPVLALGVASAFVPLALALEIALGAHPALLAGVWAAGLLGVMPAVPERGWRLAGVGAAWTVLAGVGCALAPASTAGRPLQSQVTVEQRGTEVSVTAWRRPGPGWAGEGADQAVRVSPPPELVREGDQLRVRSVRGGTTWVVRGGERLGDHALGAGATWVYGAPEGGLVVGIDPGSEVEVAEVTWDLPEGLDRRTIVGDAVPAHRGDATLVWAVSAP